jgi:hypothetical protein
MKSLLERATARPLPFIGLIIAVIAILFIFWWLLSSSTKSSVIEPKTTIIANQKMSAPVPQPEAVSTSAPIAASAVAETTAQVASDDNATGYYSNSYS